MLLGEGASPSGVNQRHTQDTTCHVYVPGRGKVALPGPPPALRDSVRNPGPGVRGCPVGRSRGPLQDPSRRRILVLLTGDALEAARAGAVHAARQSPRRPLHADAGRLCQQPPAYLRPPWLFAFGEAPAGGGWEGLGAAAGALEGPAAALCAGSWPRRKTAKLRAGEPGRRRPRHSCDRCRESRPSGAAYVAGRLRPRQLLGLWAAGEAGAAVLAHLVLRSPRASRLSTSDPGPSALRTTAPRFAGGGRGGVLPLPRVPPLRESLGGTRIPAGARLARGPILGREYPNLPGEGGPPRTLHLTAEARARVCLVYEPLFPRVPYKSCCPLGNVSAGN